jgi:ABC-type Fe3+/spermidine/putrescine transport system ATPase subunit
MRPRTLDPVTREGASPNQVVDSTDQLAAPAMQVRGLSKTYPGVARPAVDDLSLDIGRGEFLTLLGPSGCGKTTTLRIVAGLESADTGVVHFGGRPIIDVEKRLSVRPDRRNLGMVFQSYAIWPNMTVEQNVAFPLRAQHVGRAETKTRAREALELVGMSGFESRPAPMLSGGQQQRVALARAIVTRPQLLLLDEPFSSLDAKLREQLRIEMKLLQERLDIAVLFVTHDQVEALALSDRIAVMRAGVIQQLGSPRELYEQPATEFVRDFIGSTLLFAGKVHSSVDANITAVSLDGADACVVSGRLAAGCQPDAGTAVQVSVRPEDVTVLPRGARPNDSMLSGRIVSALFVGERVEYQIDVAEQRVVAIYGERRSLIERGSQVWLQVRGDGHTVWDSVTAPAAD